MCGRLFARESEETAGEAFLIHSPHVRRDDDDHVRSTYRHMQLKRRHVYEDLHLHSHREVHGHSQTAYRRVDLSGREVSR